MKNIIISVSLFLSTFNFSFANPQLDNGIYLVLWSCEIHQSGSHKNIPLKITFPKPIYSKIIKSKFGGKVNTPMMFSYGEGHFLTSIFKKKSLVKLAQNSSISIELNGKEKIPGHIGKIVGLQITTSKKFTTSLTIIMNKSGSEANFKASCQINPYAQELGK